MDLRADLITKGLPGSVKKSRQIGWNLVQAEDLMLKVEIIVQGCIDKEWCEWLGGMAMTYAEPNQTLLTGVLPDQAAVYGLIARLRDFGIQLSSLIVEVIKTEDD